MEGFLKTVKFEKEERERVRREEKDSLRSSKLEFSPLQLFFSLSALFLENKNVARQ